VGPGGNLKLDLLLQLGFVQLAVLERCGKSHPQACKLGTFPRHNPTHLLKIANFENACGGSFRPTRRQTTIIAPGGQLSQWAGLPHKARRLTFPAGKPRLFWGREVGESGGLALVDIVLVPNRAYSSLSTVDRHL
jgi:hypothetical protein